MTWLNWLGTGGGVTSIVALALLWPQIKEARARAGKSRAEAAVLEDQADDARWKALLDTHVHAVVEPLERQVARLQEQVALQDRKLAAMDERLEQVSHRYRSALGYIRTLLAWIRRHHHTDHPMDLPVAPSEIVGDL